jgi:hypothetical protein
MLLNPDPISLQQTFGCKYREIETLPDLRTILTNIERQTWVFMVAMG